MLLAATLTLCLTLASLTSVCQGHGYLADPPARASMWREGFNTPKNYNDNAINCGGYYAEWGLNKGKCGACGDPFQAPEPRDNEMGGKYGLGVISRNYTAGQVVRMKVMITANHLGYFEFRLCPLTVPGSRVTHDCLDKHVLQLADGSGTRFTLGSQVGPVEVDVRLPSSVTCQQCVVQWKYHSANSYGTEANGHGCIGCGPQEEFYGCSDVSIRTGSGSVLPTNYPPQTQAPYQPVTYPPVTQAPYVPVTYPPFTYRPTTQKPYQPITYQPFTYQPTQGPNVGPTGFVPLNPVTQGPYRPVTPRPYQPITNAPVYTPFPTYRPTTHAPVYTPRPTNAPVQTMQPQVYTPRPRPPTVPSYTNFPVQTQAPYRPVTNAPVTQAPYRPVTYAPVTQAPYRPVTYAPVTQAPYRPVTYPPVTQAPYRPVTYAPVTQAPYRPVTNAPVTQAPYRPATNAPQTLNSIHICFSIPPYQSTQMDNFCQTQCHAMGGTCPQDLCFCQYTTHAPAATQAPYQPVTYPPRTQAPYVPATYPPVTQAPYRPVTNSPVYTAQPTAYTPRPRPPLVTSGPATQAPYQPATYPPRTQAPYVPATYPPATQAPYQPATYPPVTQAPYQPFTYPPATQAPYQPATYPPITQAPYVPATYPSYTQAPYRPVTAQPTSGTYTHRPRPPLVGSTAYMPPATRAPATYRPTFPALVIQTNAPVVTYPIYTLPPVTATPRPVTLQPTVIQIGGNTPQPQNPGSQSYYCYSKPPLKSSNLDSWCNTMCLLPGGTCPPTVCECRQGQAPPPGQATPRPSSRTQVPAVTRAVTPAVTAPPAVTQPTLRPSGPVCYAVAPYTGSQQLDQWCDHNCKMVGGTCPPEYCTCRF